MSYTETYKEIIVQVKPETMNAGTEWEHVSDFAELIDGTKRELNLDGSAKAYYYSTDGRKHYDPWLEHEKGMIGEEALEESVDLDALRKTAKVFKADPYQDPEE